MTDADAGEQRAESARGEAERLRRVAEDARVEQERIREAAETSRRASEDARVAADAARHDAMESMHLTAQALKATLDQMETLEDTRRTIRAMQEKGPGKQDSH